MPLKHYTGLIERYRDRLPITENDRIISLGEGRTPLIHLMHISKSLPIDIYVKYEGLNPTGSFKDRGMTMAVTQAVNEGSEAIICASTGNTSASAAAYAARAGIKAFVLIPEGKIAMGKMAQALMYGAKVIQIKGNFDDGMQLVKEVAKGTEVTVVNSINPYRLQGQKTAAFEIIDELDSVPTHHYLPLGNAGNISAHWMGYKEYRDSGVVSSAPIMVGYQAQDSAPFIVGHPIKNPETVATAIRIGNPQSWELAQQAKAESGGWFGAVHDDDILATQKRLAQEEGVFCEPASAASVCGLLKDVSAGRIEEGSRVVCTLTGNGMKDPDTAIQQCKNNVPIQTPVDFQAVKNAIFSA